VFGAEAADAAEVQQYLGDAVLIGQRAAGDVDTVTWARLIEDHSQVATSVHQAATDLHPPIHHRYKLPSANDTRMP